MFQSRLDFIIISSAVVACIYSTFSSASGQVSPDKDAENIQYLPLLNTNRTSQNEMTLSPLSLAHLIENKDPETLFLVALALSKRNTCQNPALAEEMLIQSADLGHAGAMIALSGKYKKKGELEISRNWLHKAANAKIPGRIKDHRLGARLAIYATTRSSGSDDEKEGAFNNLTKAALRRRTDNLIVDYGDSRIWHGIAVDLLEGQVVDRNLNNAFTLFQRAADSGYKPSQEMLRSLAIIGLDANADFESLKHQIIDTATHEDGASLYKIYLLLRYKLITPQDLASLGFDESTLSLKIRILETAADAGSAEASLELSDYYKSQNESDLSDKHLRFAAAQKLPTAFLRQVGALQPDGADHPEAPELLRQASELGDPDAITALSITCLKRGKRNGCNDEAELYVKNLMNNVTRNHDTIAAYFLGERYKHNIRGEFEGLPLHYAASFAALRVAVYGKDPRAYYELGDSYLSGIGTVVSEVDALFWLIRASNIGKKTKRMRTIANEIPTKMESLLKNANLCEVR